MAGTSRRGLSGLSRPGGLEIGETLTQPNPPQQAFILSESRIQLVHRSTYSHRYNQPRLTRTLPYKPQLAAD